MRANVEVLELPVLMEIIGSSGRTEKIIPGISIAVMMDGSPVWEKNVYDRLTGDLGMFLNHLRLPFYPWRLRRARKQAQSVLRAIDPTSEVHILHLPQRNCD